MKRALIGAVLLTATVAVAQAVPASITSTRPGFTTIAPPPSITSMGPAGFGPQIFGPGFGPHHFGPHGFGPFFPSPCVGFGVNVHTRHVAGGIGFGNCAPVIAVPVAVPAYPYYYPFAYGADYGYAPPMEVAPPAPEPEAAEPAPTVFDRGAGYTPAPRAGRAEPQPEQEQAQREEPRQAENVPEPEPVVLVFRDGHKLEVKNYAIIGSTLIDLTAGHRRRIALDELDIAATTKLNDERGVDFTLPKKRA